MLEDHPVIPLFSVFPNPADNVVTISCNAVGKVDYLLFSVSGIQIQSGQFEGSTPLHIENYPAGIYFLELQSEAKKQVQKLIIE